jgi:hypothetical protein
MKVQYASGRTQITALNVSTTSGNLTVPQTYYFWIQGRNDIGFNLPSIVSSVSVTAGQGISITIPADCYRSGENWQQFVISAGTENDHSTSTVICVIDAVIASTQEPITLPKTITITEDSHLDLSREGVSTFPSGANLTEGMIRLYNANGNIYRYHPNSSDTVDGVEVIGASTGRWLKYLDEFNNSITDTTNTVNGADMALLEITDTSKLLPYKYALDGSQGKYRRLWILNQNSSEPISKGERVGFVITVNGVPASEDFESLLKIVYEGISNPATGLLDIVAEDEVSPQKDIGVEKPYTFEASDIVIAKDIQPNYCWQCRVFPEFHSYQLKSLPAYLSDISIYPFIFAESGTYNDASAIVGDVILPYPTGLRRVYPSSLLEVLVDEGSGTVNGYFFKDKASVNILNLDVDTANQKVIINNSGDVYTSDIVQDFEAQRALVSTVSGESHCGAFAASVTADVSPNFTIQVPYPSSIRSNYPDVIAGSSRGVFNVDEIIFFIRKNGVEIRKFLGFIPTNTTSDTFTAVWAEGAVTPNLNTDYFGLWTPLAPSSVVPTTTGTDVYEVCVSFRYLGNAVTDISHSVNDGCIIELTRNLADIAESTQIWQYPISNRSSLETLVPANLINYETRFTFENENLCLWTWFEASTNNSSNSIKPASITSVDPGRWIRFEGGIWSSSIDTYAALTAIPSASIQNFETRLVLENRPPEIWVFDALSTDNTTNITLRPDDILIENPGRWLKSGGSGGGGTVNVEFQTTPPSTTPLAAGTLYSDTLSNFVYLSKDTISPDDWLNVTFEPERIVTHNGNVLTHNGHVVYVNEPTPETIEIPVDDRLSVADDDIVVSENVGRLNFKGSGAITVSGDEVVINFPSGGGSTAPSNLPISTGAITIDAPNQNYYILTLTENITTINLTNFVAGSQATVYVLQDATGGRTIAGWPVSVGWENGIPSFGGVANSWESTIYLYSPDGTTILGGFFGGGSSGHSIKDEGSTLTTRSSLNFVGGGVTVTDANPDTQIEIPGFTVEQAQDAVGGILDDGTLGDIVFSYDDIGNTIHANLKSKGTKETLLGNRTLDASDPYYCVFDTASDYLVNLYNGGSQFQHHFIINTSTTNTLDVVNESSVSLSVLNPGEQALVMWDTTTWRLL